MRLQLMDRAFARATLLALALVAIRGAAHADGRLTLHGAYFREASTRVIEPMVQVSQEVGEGLDVSANYLLDAVTSASVAAGVDQDAVFSERRHEAGMSVGYTFDRSLHPTRIGGAFRISGEPDYKSGTVALQFSREVWGRSGTLAVVLARTGDHIVTRMIDKRLDTTFGAISYTQALSPTLLLQGGYELYYLDGYQSNPYVDTPNLGRPAVPLQRLRHVAAGRAAQYFPAMQAGVQLHYRFYFDQAIRYTADPWGLTGHTVEGRLYKTLARDFEVRLSYRLHQQSQADFWCNTNRAIGGNPDCYGPLARFHSADVKYGPLITHMPEFKITWELHALGQLPWLAGLSFLTAGAVDLSYARFFQDTAYGDAHLLQAGYSLPF